MSALGSEPVGTIIAWTGQFPTFSNWFLCDGRAYATEEFPDLFSVIGTSYGSPTNDNTLFCVPNLAGQFLRGVTGSSLNDPDALTRTAPQPFLPVQGNSGNEVGSLQGYATAQPGNPFTSAIHGLPTGNNSCESPAGAPDDIAISHPDQWNNHWTDTSGGGDKETRPINKSVWYLIKATSEDNQGNATELPTGSIIGYAGPDFTKAPQYILCDGEQGDPNNQALFAAMGTVNGGGGQSNYFLPDLRGYFLRGAGFPPTSDPDAALRGFARPDLPAGQQGASGFACGSSQDWATGRPNAKFQTNFLWCPDDGVHAWNSAGRRDGLTNWGTSITVAVTGARGNSGGDPESRPSNYAVDWLLKSETGIETPVGGVIAYAGPLPLPDSAQNWRPCHGDTVFPSDPAFPSISAAIGTTYGSSGGGINLPDYRGLFLRGRDAGAGRDPNGGNRKVGSFEGFATGVPNNPFTAAPANLPAHGEQVFSSGPHDPSEWPDGDFATIQTNTGGGDKESRPTNSYVEFLIRVM
jgi:microcystin-dependent protein